MTAHARIAPAAQSTVHVLSPMHGITVGKDGLASGRRVAVSFFPNSARIAQRALCRRSGGAMTP